MEIPYHEDLTFVDTNVLIDDEDVPQSAAITPKVWREVEYFNKKGKIAADTCKRLRLVTMFPESAPKGLNVLVISKDHRKDFYRLRKMALEIARGRFQNDSLQDYRARDNISMTDAELAAYCVLTRGKLLTNDKLLRVTVQEMKKY